MHKGTYSTYGIDVAIDTSGIKSKPPEYHLLYPLFLHNAWHHYRPKRYSRYST